MSSLAIRGNRLVWFGNYYCIVIQIILVFRQFYLYAIICSNLINNKNLMVVHVLSSLVIRGNRLVWFENKYLVVVLFLRSRTHFSSNNTRALWRPKEMLTYVVTLMLMLGSKKCWRKKRKKYNIIYVGTYKKLYKTIIYIKW